MCRGMFLTGSTLLGAAIKAPRIASKNLMRYTHLCYSSATPLPVSIPPILSPRNTANSSRSSRRSSLCSGTVTRKEAMEAEEELMRVVCLPFQGRGRMQTQSINQTQKMQPPTHELTPFRPRA